MTPRNYDMTKRAAAAAQTRRRIVDATLALHAEKGIAATSWDDIASRARVGVGTVYRHFPSLDELIPACGDVAMQVVAAPDPSGLFEHASEPRERIERLVGAVFAMYERGAAELRAIRRGSDVHPRVAEDREAFEASLDALVDSALDPFDTTGLDRAVARAMLDLNTWQALRDRELEPAECVAVIVETLAARLLPAGR